MARPQINIRASEQQRETWKEYVEERPELDSLADLIRTAVAHELSDEYGLLAKVESGSEGGGISDERIGELVETVGSMRHRMDSLETTVSDATDALYTSQTTDDNLVSGVFEMLPESREQAVTDDDVAEQLAIPKSQARVALESLYDSTRVVEKDKHEYRGEENALFYKTT